MSQRGMLTGNRGCLVDDRGEVVRHHRGRLWIACLTEYRGWRSPLDRPGHWTPLFFLDDAVAFAAGHRPCGLCRRAAYRSYRDAVSRAMGRVEPLRAPDLDARLAAERLGPGRGITRASDRLLWTAPIGELPPGTVVVGPELSPMLLLADRLLTFGFDGWRSPIPRPGRAVVEVLTPPTSVAGLANGYEPVLHPTASGDRL